MDLDDSAFAFAVSALGVLSTRAQSARVPDLADRLASLVRASTLNWAAGNSTQVSWQQASSIESFWKYKTPNANRLAEAWLAFRRTHCQSLCLILAASTIVGPLTSVEAIRLSILLTLLAHPNMKVVAISVVWRAQHQTGCRWTLRVGLLDDRDSTDVAIRIDSFYSTNTWHTFFHFPSRKSQLISPYYLPPQKDTRNTWSIMEALSYESTLDWSSLFHLRIRRHRIKKISNFEKTVKEMHASGFYAIRGSLHDSLRLCK